MPMWLSVLFALCCVLATAGCGFLAFTTAPAALRRQVNILRAEVQECQVAVEALAQKWTTHKAAFEGLAEEIEDNLGRIEKKRRQAAASAAKAERDNGQPQSPEEQRLMAVRHARSLGFDV